MESSPRSAPARRSWWRSALLQLALLPVWLVVAELLFRGALWARGEPYRAEAARTVIVTQLNALATGAPLAGNGVEKVDAGALALRRAWHAHPYYGFENAMVSAAIEKEIARQRGPRDPSEYTIWILGGSVAMGFDPDGMNALQKKLLEDPRFSGRTIRFLDCAQPSFKEPQQLMQFAYMLDLGIAPDALINLDGFNESAFAWSNIDGGVNPLYPEIGIWAHQVQNTADDRESLDLLLDIREMQRQVTTIAEFALQYRLYESSLLGRMTLSRLAWRTSRASYKRAQYVALVTGKDTWSVLRGPKLPDKWSDSVDVAVRAWSESSRSLQDMCRSRSIHYVHALQPTLFDTGSKPLTPSEIATQGHNPHYENGAKAMYPRLRKAGESLRSEGVNFHDCSMAFADLHEPVYYDHCHFNRQGYEIVAERIGEAFLKSLPPAEELAKKRTAR